MTSLRLRMLEDMQIRNLAVNTQESYVQQISLFARYFNQSPERLGPEQIRTYQLYLTKERKLATSSILMASSFVGWICCKQQLHDSAKVLTREQDVEVRLRESSGLTN